MPSKRKAFTVTELLIVIGIIALLVGIVVVAMGGVRNAANRTESANALRQMVAAYAAYATEHRQHLLPGYIREDMIGDETDEFDFRVRLPGLAADLQPGDVQGYVWRLAPYLDNSWQTMMVDYRNRGIVSDLQREYDAGRYGPATINAADEDIGIASAPSFGLNSIFVGGDTQHGGSDCVDASPYDVPSAGGSDAPLAAVRMSTVRNPSRLIVFGPVARADANVDPGTIEPYTEPVQNTQLGYVELRAPYTHPATWDNEPDWQSWTNQQWRVGTGGHVEASDPDDFSEGAGLPIVRWGTTQYPVGHLDGSTVIDDIVNLSTDMRRWSPFAVGLDRPEIDGY